MRRFLPLAGLLSVTALCLVLLHRLGSAAPGPVSWSGAELKAWVTDTNPVLVAMAVLRVVALGVGYQLFASAGLAAVGSVAHLPTLLRASDLFALPGMRGLVRRAAAATVSASTLFAAPALPAHLATLRVDGTGSTVTLVVDGPAPGAGQVTLTLEPPPAAADAAATEPATDQAPPVSSDDQAPDHWTVARGDHLWSIAERTLAVRWERSPSEREIDRYWRQVLGANAGLADPDVLFAGQQIALPPVPSP